MKHIIITGDRAVGKSALISRLLSQNTRPVCGFFTKKHTPRADGLTPVYLHPAAREWVCTEENLIGLADTRIRSAFIMPFETLGVQSLTPIKNGLVVMDELGFIESRAQLFTRTVLATLDGELPVLAAVKAMKDVPFLDAVRNHPNSIVYEITPENRDALYETLRSIVMQWNREADIP